MPQDNMKQVSIIIVTYNSEKDIFDCVDSIKQHADIPKDDIELIIVDNCSREPQAMFDKLKEQWGDDIKLIENDKNGGYGQGNNVGIRRATAPIILIMNPDVRLMEPVLATAIQAFWNSRTSMVGMKQMRTPKEPSTNSFSCTYMMNGYLYTLVTSVCNQCDWYIPSLMHFSGSCFFIRKSMFEEIGLFDESNFMYGEEDDIHYRIKERFGTHMKYMPKLHYIHLSKETPPGLKYWKQVVDVAATLNEKKGYPRKKTILNRWRNNRMLIAQHRIYGLLGKEPSDMLQIKKDYQTYLEQLLHESNKKTAMKNGKLEILMSCMHQTDTCIVQRSNVQSNVTVINQCEKEEIEEKTFLNKHNQPCTLKFISTKERGLSRSRNMAIRNATSEICLIADDDEHFEDDIEDIIIKAFMQNPEADMILFKVDNFKASGKKQFQTSGRVGYKKALSVVSAQIAFKRQSIIDNGIIFDEEMGSGTGHGAGEETKFLFDCLRHRLNVIHLPISIGYVDKKSESQWFKGYTPTFFLQRGWATKRYLGTFWAIIYAIYYTITKHSMYSKDLSFAKALWYSIKGVFSKEV